MKGWGKYDIGTAVKKKTGKSFIDYMGPEDICQHQVIQWCRLHKIVFHHSPNFGKRTPFEQFKYVYLGSDSGFPDLMLFKKGKTIAIELKIGKNRLMPSQVDWLNFLNECGIVSKCCYGYDEAIGFIKEQFLV